jgi:transposase
MVFLPQYSPELNPCELVFSQIKSHLRKLPYGKEDLVHSILKYSTKVTPINMINYYTKCINPKHTLPELNIDNNYV